jgi:nucleotide-binding universal stress UspA family protein
MQPPTRVLAPVDLEAIAWSALEYAGWLACQSGAIVDVLYASPVVGRPRHPVENGGRERMLIILATLTERFSRATELENGGAEPIFIGNMQPGDPAEVILGFSDLVEHDVIVMGNHGRKKLSHLIHGTVAESVVRDARSPVLVVPTPSSHGLYGDRAEI